MRSRTKEMLDWLAMYRRHIAQGVNMNGLSFAGWLCLKLSCTARQGERWAKLALEAEKASAT
jgi:hypothetical protein